MENRIVVDKKRQWLELGCAALLAAAVVAGAFAAAHFVKGGNLKQVEQVPDVRILYTELMDRYMMNIKPDTYKWYLIKEGDVRTVTSGGLPQYDNNLPEVSAIDLSKVSLVFSSKPSDFTVSYKLMDSDEDFVTIPPNGMTINLPGEVGKYEILVDARWHNANGTHFDGVASYVFIAENYDHYGYSYDLAEEDFGAIELGKP